MNSALLVPILKASTEYMSSNTKFLHHLVLDVTAWSMYILELLSILIIVYTTLVAFFKLFRREHYARVYLLHGQSLGLTFKLGAEILKTVTATSLLDIFEVFLLIVIKACMVMLIERELKSTGEDEMEQTLEAERQKRQSSKTVKPKFTLHGMKHPDELDENGKPKE